MINGLYSNRSVSIEILPHYTRIIIISFAIIAEGLCEKLFQSDIDTPAVSAVVVQHIPTGLSFISISPRGYRSSFSNKSSPLTELSLSVVKKGPHVVTL